MPRRRCRNCPEKPGEAEALWQQTIVACGNSLDAMARCVASNPPIDAASQMQRLAGRLNEIIQTCERRNAITDSVE